VFFPLLSPLARERGLESSRDNPVPARWWSPLARERGLESGRPADARPTCRVAARTRARVRIWAVSRRSSAGRVAARTRARVRIREDTPENIGQRVAARTRARVRICLHGVLPPTIASPLARERGLEFVIAASAARQIKSPLARERGLESAPATRFRASPTSPLARERGLEFVNEIVWRRANPKSPLARERGLESHCVEVIQQGAEVAARTRARVRILSAPAATPAQRRRRSHASAG